MKNFLLFIVLISPFAARAQKLTDYKASNGITYHVNDTVRLGKGSAPKGEFMYIQDHGIPSPHGSHNLPREFTNLGIIIKSIKNIKLNGIDKCQFIVSTGGILRYSVFIDDAILACEVVPCATSKPPQVASVADELKKLKELLDSGVLTQTEFDAQKRKLLNQ